MTLAYLVCGSPGPSVLNVILTLVVVATVLVLGGAVVLFVGTWLCEKLPWLAPTLGCLLVVGMVGMVIGGVYVSGHPPECAKSDTCAVDCPTAALPPEAVR